MAWSTQQVAELAGTTVKAVRHYHAIGLLDLPERNSNGYKQYEVRHLVSLLRITRLTELDVPLAQIAAVSSADITSDDALRSLDAELASNIARLGRVRSELALILGRQSSTEMPAGLGPLVAGMSEADRSLLLVYSRVFGPAELSDLHQMLVALRKTSVHQQFDLLPPDADESTRKSLVRRYAIELGRLVVQYPWMSVPESRALRGKAFADNTINQALHDIYNSAQLDVLAQVNDALGRAG